MDVLPEVFAEQIREYRRDDWPAVQRFIFAGKVVAVLAAVVLLFVLGYLFGVEAGR